MSQMYYQAGSGNMNGRVLSRLPCHDELRYG